MFFLPIGSRQLKGDRAKRAVGLSAALSGNAETRKRYAEQRGYQIIRVFEDSGRSGLNIDGRDGLNSLMLEVQFGTADFQAILVYDVSRWGRFQDAD